MTRSNYPALATRQISKAGCFVSRSPSPASVRVDSPALKVMTDLSRIPPATIVANASIHDANHTMMCRGVRLLFVTDDSRRITGIITATDILGERPMQTAQQRGLRIEELRVADIMTPAAHLDAIDLSMVTRAEVGHVVATLKACARQHAIVVDRNAEGEEIVVGVFSSTQIARQLGVTLHGGEKARTFAELEAAIAGS